jgi:hypothetical protein
MVANIGIVFRLNFLNYRKLISVNFVVCCHYAHFKFDRLYGVGYVRYQHSGGVSHELQMAFFAFDCACLLCCGFLYNLVCVLS